MVNIKSNDEGLRELALFAGAGGGILGGKLLGWRTVCAVENNEYARNVLMARQNDGSLSPFPIWDDVCTFDGKPWKGIIDVISGGFPCQDISAAGKGAGIDGERSGLWKQYARIIREVLPRFVFVENSPMLTVCGLGRVLGDLAEMGYDAKWGVLGAIHAGLNHERKRIWIIANSNAQRGNRVYWRPDTIRRNMEKYIKTKPQTDRFMEELERQGTEWKSLRNESSLPSYLCRVDNGLAANVDRLERIGNGQVPAVVKLAWKILMGK